MGEARFGFCTLLGGSTGWSTLRRRTPLIAPPAWTLRSRGNDCDPRKTSPSVSSSNPPYGSSALESVLMMLSLVLAVRHSLGGRGGVAS